MPSSDTIRDAVNGFTLRRYKETGVKICSLTSCIDRLLRFFSTVRSFVERCLMWTGNSHSVYCSLALFFFFIFIFCAQLFCIKLRAQTNPVPYL